MKYVKSIYEKRPKGSPKWHDADWPDAEGRFKELSPKDLAAWLIKTRKKDLKAISGALTQQVVFNRKEDPKYAEKMEKTRKEVYKQLGRKDLLEKVNINKVEDYADDVLDPTDVEFTRHFFDRLTRVEHDKDITDAELIGFFKRLAKKKKQFDSFMKQYDEFIVKDKRTDINIPFIKRVNQIIAKTIMRKKDFISSNPTYTFEAYMINEIGDASAKPMKYKVLGKDIKNTLKDFDAIPLFKERSNDVTFTWEFTNDEGVKYVCKLEGTMHKEKVLQLSFDNTPKEPKYDRYVFLKASFNLAGRKERDESQTNMNEQFRVLSTVVSIIKGAIKDITDVGFRIDAINIPPKGDFDDSPSNIDSKRGRFYLAYLKRSIKSLPGKWSVVNRKYNSATYFALVPGKLSGANIMATNEAKSNDSFNDYPAAAKANAKKALEWRDKYGREEVDAGTQVGWARANQLAKGENLSAETVKRMAAFNRHRKNSKIATEYKDTPWKDRGYVAWLIWGGDEGVDWAIEKSKEIDNMKESTSLKYVQTLNEFNRGKDENNYSPGT